MDYNSDKIAVIMILLQLFSARTCLKINLEDTLAVFDDFM